MLLDSVFNHIKYFIPTDLSPLKLNSFSQLYYTFICFFSLVIP